VNSIRFKLSGIILLVLAIMGGLFYFRVTSICSDIVNEQISAKLYGDADLSYAFVEKTYPGPWNEKNGKLYKGPHLINGESEVVDLIKEKTGAAATFFLHDVRVATNVTRDGERAVGTKASAPIAEQVLQRHQPYEGIADVVGTPYQAHYRPLKDSQGEVVGMWFVGIPRATADQQIQVMKHKIALITVGVLLFALVLISWYTGILFRSIRKILDSLDRMGQGDLTVDCQIRTGDEMGKIGQQINQTTSNIKHILRETLTIKETIDQEMEQMVRFTEQVSTVSEQVGEAIDQVAQGSQEQASEVEASVLLTSELSEKINSIACIATNIGQQTGEVQRKTEEGSSTIQFLQERIEANSQIAVAVANGFQDLVAKSQQINAIADAINSIATQTNLLSLNAAIEAARAGDAGKGFTVVAQEVGKLAEESAEATKNIKNIIEEIAQTLGMASEAVGKMGQISSRVEDALKETSNFFHGIEASVQNISQHINDLEITMQTANQTRDAVTQAIENISQVSEETAAIAQEVSASVQQQISSVGEVHVAVKEVYTSLNKLQDQLTVFSH
jgi:methyl-accepting chemotaxis protein